MALKKLLQMAVPQCAKCPYALGLVKVLVSPCPQCGGTASKPFVFPPGSPDGLPGGCSYHNRNVEENFLIPIS